MTREFGDLVHILVAKRLGTGTNKQTNTMWALNYVRIWSLYTRGWGMKVWCMLVLGSFGKE
jgi:hypothetical protein